ncbi:MAG TPA: phosphopantetheine-binding protein [Duganella sp.]|uniref:acyl carrier protein n=1 Tax=Duganella sp. TaxID=1904440 RepID=UPI002ED1A834
MQLESVKTILGDVLSLGSSAQALTRDSALLGSIPELDSMAVVQLLTALEEHYGITIEDDDISAHTFATVGSLADFISDKMAA